MLLLLFARKDLNKWENEAIQGILRRSDVVLSTLTGAASKTFRHCSTFDVVRFLSSAVPFPGGDNQRI